MGKKFNELQIDEDLKSKLEKSPEDYVAINFRQYRGVMKVFKKSETTPEQLSEVGDLFARKWEEEVIDKIDKIVTDFIEENGLLPIACADVVDTNIVDRILSESSMVTSLMGNKNPLASLLGMME